MKVAVAVIVDEKQRILITQRPLHASHGGLWEFPGGKLESDETAEQALCREVQEEVGLTLLNWNLLTKITHHYPNKSVELIVFYINQFEGIAFCREGQLNMKWVEANQLNPTDFPEANQAILDLL